MLTQNQVNLILSRNLEDYKDPSVIDLFLNDETFKSAILNILEEDDQIKRELLLSRTSFFVNLEIVGRRDAEKKDQIFAPLFEVTELKEHFCSFIYQNGIYLRRNVRAPLWTEISEMKCNLLKNLLLENTLNQFAEDERYKNFKLISRNRADQLRWTGDLIDE